MHPDSLTGLFGKLPAHGDFIHRNLPMDVVTTWDEWLQHFIAGTREQMGEAWLDIYLTSPLWRFVFTPGVIDTHAWAGVLMPSVDRVGRYFPFSVLTRLPGVLNPLEFLTLHSDWFAQIEDIALSSLDGELMADDLMPQIEAVGFQLDSLYTRNAGTADSGGQIVDMDFEEQSPLSTYSYLLDALLTKTYASYSAWSTSGSERVAPCVFTVQGLPPIDGVPALLDGQWQQWNWNKPYTLSRHDI